MNSAASADRSAQAWALLDTVPDPEVPALSLCDLGIVREVHAGDPGIEVVLTPTYSGCPATEAIERSVIEALDGAGLGPARVRMQRAPAWTTDWISERGRARLREYGIAPPGVASGAEAPGAACVGEAPIRFVARRPPVVPCPRCGSDSTEQLSAFGSTACKSLYRCLACREPFEHFKPI